MAEMFLPLRSIVENRASWTLEASPQKRRCFVCNVGCQTGVGIWDVLAHMIGGRSQQGSVRAFELQQETWKLSWASVFCQVKGCAFSGFHLFQGLARSYFLVVLNLDNDQWP